jgi:TRAP-type C4-dicarboxylate transport system permease small subunit
MEQLGRALNAISATALIVVVTVTLADVLASEVWGSPFSGVYDVVQVATGICVFLAMPAVFLSDSNIRVEIVDMLAAHPVIRLLRTTALLASLVFLSILLCSTLLQARDALRYRSQFFEIGVSHLAVWLPIIGSTLISILCVLVVLFRTFAATNGEKG